mgnify:CR=1 FL=1
MLISSQVDCTLRLSERSEHFQVLSSETAFADGVDEVGELAGTV